MWLACRPESIVVASKLDRYHAKRNFSRTGEPAGEVVEGSTGRLRFIVQKHAARRLHYDLRLELDGVLKSWAVTRGPSINPADKRLAVQVEDHPLSYGDFEGTIPEGEYGGGTVQLWDRGYWQPQPGVSPRQSLREGELKFRLFGQRLTGSWVLVRMRHSREGAGNTGGNGSGRADWLLIKHRDSQLPPQSVPQKQKEQRAACALLEEDASVASGRTMAEITAGKGRKPKPFMTKDVPGVSVAVSGAMFSRSDAGRAGDRTKGARVRRANAGDAKRVKRLPQFIEPELCQLSARPPLGEQWLHEVKLDGYRLQLRVTDGKAQLRSRKGLNWTARLKAMVCAASGLPDCIIDGELVALDGSGGPSFAVLQAALAERRTDELVFYAFDLLFLEQLDLRDQPLVERKRQLRTLLSGHSSQLAYVDHIRGHGDTAWLSACRSQLEGIVSKRSAAAYRSGRGSDWVKSKCRAGQEVVIGGMTTDHEQLRSLLVGVMRNRKLVYIGRVGAGFGASVSKRVLTQLRPLVTDINPFHGSTAPRGGARVSWLTPRLVAEIAFAGWTSGGMVRHAAFKGLRQDKRAMDVQAEAPVVDQLSVHPANRAAGNSRSRITAGDGNQRRTDNKTQAKVVAGITLSHPDRILWPAMEDHPVTKLDLAEYYLRVSQWLIPHIERRPCSIVRAPNGIEGEQFFQRHRIRGTAPQLHVIKLTGDRKPYLTIDSSKALVAVAQMAGLELHPGNGLPGRPDIPGRLVFDLDPAPEVDFKRVIKAALELGERLSALGITSFCKTTGGKGLHVVAPLSARHVRGKSADWPTAKLFAQTLCAQLAADNPDQYLINPSKAARRDKIFLDYLRNDRLATAVAPLSPRARLGAPVSMPLRWSQVRAGLDPQRFTVRSVSERLSKGDPWQNYFEVENSLISAAERLLKGIPSPAA